MKTLHFAALAAALLAPAPLLAAPAAMSRAEIVALGKSGVGYSYWWGHGRWRSDGAQHGSCSGGCPSCSHSGSYGADCSGFVAKAWQVPGPSAVTTDSHPYSTVSFTCNSTHWSHISMSSLQQADGASYNTDCGGGGRGHVVLYDQKATSGYHWTWEAKCCECSIVHNKRTFTGSYKGLRRDNLSTGTTPPPPPPDPVPEEVEVMSALWDEAAATSDMNGDGKADLCARAAAGFTCYPSKGAGFEAAVTSTHMSNAAGWGAAKYYSTIRMADINGDGKADVCGRASDRIHCWLSTGSAFATEVMGPMMPDANGWGQLKYYATIRFADVNGDGKADVCARASDGIHCWTSNGDSFGAGFKGPAWTDASGWDGIQYYSTIRMADINADGKADICARSSAGMECWLSNGAGFPTKVTGPALSNASGWGAPEHYLTIRMGDVNADKRADICARGAAGFMCWLSGASGFSGGVNGGAMSDAGGWGDIVYYSSIRLGDVNGDQKLDVCARGAAGMFCWLWGTGGFTTRLTGPAWSNSAGWNDVANYRTIRVADVNGDGKADLCARGNSAVFCAPSTGTGFGAAVNSALLTDASGWTGLQYYATLRMASAPPKPPSTPTCTPTGPETCDGVDNNCDGDIDENLDCNPPDAGQPDDNVLPDEDGGTADWGEEDEDGGIPGEEETDAGSSAGASDAGRRGDAGLKPFAPEEGCGCGTSAGGSFAGAGALLLLAMAMIRRKAR